MKRVFGILAALSFLFLFGTVGAVEQDMIPLGIGTIRMAFGLFGFWLFTWLAGGFDPSPCKKKSCPRNSSPKGSKQKSSH